MFRGRDVVRVVSTGAAGCRAAPGPVGPITGGSLAHSHSTLTRDHFPKLNTVPAAYFQEDVIPTSYRPLALQSADDGNPELPGDPLWAGGTRTSLLLQREK